MGRSNNVQEMFSALLPEAAITVIQMTTRNLKTILYQLQQVQQQQQPLANQQKRKKLI